MFVYLWSIILLNRKLLMENSKVIRYLKLFNKHGLNRLESFLSSPCNHVYPDVLVLFKVLKKYYPDYTASELQKEKLYSAVFPGEAFSQQKLGNNLKYLAEFIEEFLVDEQLQKKKALKAQLLAERLRNEDNYLYKDAIAKAALVLDKSDFTDTGEYLYLKLNYHSEKDIFFSISEARAQDNEIQLKNEGLDVWFMYHKLKIWCEMHNRQNIVSVQYNYTLQQELLAFLKKEGENIARFPAITIYHTIYLSLTEPSKEEHYRKLLDLLKRNENKLSHAELRGMYDFAQNYCIKKLNSGDISYADKLFALYQYLIEKKILFTDTGKLSPWDYKNIVTLSLRLKKNDWCHAFIERYKAFLPRDESENAYRYNLAYYYVNNEQYKEAKRLLQRVEFNDLFYQLGAKSVLLRSYYELRDEDSFFAHCESFAKLLLRHKTVSDYQRKVHLNLILHTKKIFRLMQRRTENRSNVSKKEIDQARQKIQAVKQINNLAWLLEKVEEIS